VNGPPDRDPDRDRQSVRAGTLIYLVYLVFRTVVALPVIFVMSFWRVLIWPAIALALFTAVFLVFVALPRAFPWPAEKGMPNQGFLAGLTVVVLVLLVAVLVAHGVILTRRFPRPRPTPIKPENRRLDEIVEAVHSAIEAGRRG
jgi:hypothetical protein